MAAETISQPTEPVEQDLVKLYLDDAVATPLLTRQEEVRLAQTMEAGKQAAARLAAAEEGTFVYGWSGLLASNDQQSRQSGELAKEQFIKANLRLVVNIAKRYHNAFTKSFGLLDAIQEGNLGLMHSVDKYDWQRGFKFSTYAAWWIRQSISKGLSNTSRTIRLPVDAEEASRNASRERAEFYQEQGRNPTLPELSERTGLDEDHIIQYSRTATISLDDAIGDKGDKELIDFIPAATVDPLEVAIAGLRSEKIKDMLNGTELNDQERQIIRLYYGLEGNDPHLPNEIAQIFGIDKHRVDCLKARAIRKLSSIHRSDDGLRDLL